MNLSGSKGCIILQQQQLMATGQWFSFGTMVSSTNKTDHHDIAEILLKVALNTITLPLQQEHDAI